MGWSDILGTPHLQTHSFEKDKNQEKNIEKAFCQILRLFDDIEISEDRVHLIFKSASYPITEEKFIDQLVLSSTKNHTKIDFKGIVGMELSGKKCVDAFISAAVEVSKQKANTTDDSINPQ